MPAIPPALNATPIADHELNDLFLCLNGHFPLTLAVSGGVDSVCLMHLIAAWLKCRQSAHAPASCADAFVQVVTVDHGLRADAADEALFVKDAATALGFAHKTLLWVGQKPQTGIQQAARKARYSLIQDFLRAQQSIAAQKAAATPVSQTPAIVTGHHQDDQAETVLMRLGRGSGVDGLAAMAMESQFNGMVILRPLLQISKSRLAATVQDRGLAVVEDPSNHNRDFERVRLRRAAPALSAAGLDNYKLSLTARRLGRAKAALEEFTDDLARRAKVKTHELGYVELDFEVFSSAAEELRIRLLGRLISFFGTQDSPVRLRKLEELSAALTDPAFTAATLNRCHIVVKGGALLILREPGRSAIGECSLAPGQSMLWDHRFYLSVSPDFVGPVKIRPLCHEGWRALIVRYPVLSDHQLWHLAVQTLPAFWTGDTVLGTPTLQGIVTELGGRLSDGTPAFKAEIRKII